MGTQYKDSAIFIVENFIEPHQCAEIRAEAEQSSAVPARVTKTGPRVDIQQRRTSRVFVSPESERLISGRLKELQPKIAEYYKTQLSGFENLQFLLYKAGDFYKAHSDKTNSPDLPQYIKDRRVSVVIFLSNESAETDGYTGGSFVIHKALEGTQSQKINFRLQGKEGKLIAFPSTLLHEVERVESGQRYSIVSWFF